MSEWCQTFRLRAKCSLRSAPARLVAALIAIWVFTARLALGQLNVNLGSLTAGTGRCYG